MSTITPYGFAYGNTSRCSRPAVLPPMGDDALIRLTNLKALGHGPADLVRLVGSSYPYWRDLLAGQKSFGEKAARNIEEKLGLPRGCLDVAEGCLGRRIPRPVEPNGVLIPEYATGGSMGVGLVLRDQPGMIRRWDVTREWIEKNVPYYSSLDNLAIVTGFGDSMIGLFNPGDPLLVDRGITKADVDGVYFFRIGDEGFIKRLQRIPGQGILVISENQKYRDWTITPDMDFEVMAKVLKAWNGHAL